LETQDGNVPSTRRQECLRYANTSRSSLGVSASLLAETEFIGVGVLALKKAFNQSAGAGQAPAGLEVWENRVATKIPLLTELKEALEAPRHLLRRIRRGLMHLLIATTVITSSMFLSRATALNSIGFWPPKSFRFQSTKRISAGRPAVGDESLFEACSLLPIFRRCDSLCPLTWRSGFYGRSVPAQYELLLVIFNRTALNGFDIHDYPQSPQF